MFKTNFVIFLSSLKLQEDEIDKDAVDGRCCNEKKNLSTFSTL